MNRHRRRRAEADEIMRDLEQRRQYNEDRKRREIATETAVRKLTVDWSRFQSELKQLGGCGCNGDLRRCRRILEEMGLPQSEIAIVLSYLSLCWAANCDCEVFYNVDMTDPCPFVSMDCADCGANYDEYYIVKDEVWAASGLEPCGGQLCIGCLERRLDRRLSSDDFKSISLNEIHDGQSLRLRDRLSRQP